MAGASELIPTPFGDMEYAVAGEGPSLLMIHGTGGGFDQGLTFADAIIRRGRRIISPSRFGYLRSAFPADPSSENQADAFVRLLDHLKIDRLPVAGGSAGALSAPQFALRHPDRCLVRQDQVDLGVELEPDSNAVPLGADKGEGARLLDQLRKAFNAALRFSPGDEIPSTGE